VELKTPGTREGTKGEPLKLRASEGEHPKEGEGQESQSVAEGEIPEPTTPTGEGMKPLKRGRALQQCLQRW